MYLAIWKKKEIRQMQITDYVGDFKVIFFDMSDANHRHYYELLLNGMGIKRKKKVSKPDQLPKFQIRLG
ncbi:MAG: hypothetical protein ACTSRG_26310 [Candidatus Helarchaeota archaeon]